MVVGRIPYVVHFSRNLDLLTHTLLETVSFLYHLFLFMAQNPDAQRKAQVEIDGVTGGSRLPLLSDRSALPYVDALIKELLRCAVVAPQGNARQLQNHDVYRGYFIPAKAVVIPNIWCVIFELVILAFLLIILIQLGICYTTPTNIGIHIFLIQIDFWVLPPSLILVKYGALGAGFVQEDILRKILYLLHAR
jgi:hypothetical protein